MCSLIVSQIEMFEVHRRIMYFTESTQQWNEHKMEVVLNLKF